MRDGFQRASGKSIYLESTTPRSRDIYAHLGFEVRRSRSGSPQGRFGVLSLTGLGGQRASIWRGIGRRNGHSSQGRSGGWMAVFYHDEGALLVHVGLARQLIRVRTSGRIHEPRSHMPLIQLS